MTKLRDLGDLKKAFTDRAIARQLERAESGNSAALGALRELGLQSVPKDKRSSISDRYYYQAKALLAEGKAAEATAALDSAHVLRPESNLLSDRLRLLKALPLRASVIWRMSLQNLQRDLAVPCARHPCRCTSHFQVAACQGMLEDGFVHQHTVRGVMIYTVGPYHSRSYSGKWTKLLKRVKHAPYDAAPLKPMADILADFIAEQTPLLGEVDVLIPIPPSPAKYAERGFAPNDIVAGRVGARLALPVWEVLVRRDGIDTKEASDAQLAAQFEVRAPVGKRLSGLTVLLVEDIWTAGRTIPICARKLAQFQPTGVYAAALARTKG